MSKKKRNKKPKTPKNPSELLDAIKNKYFDGKRPADEKQRHAINFLFDTYSFNLNNKSY